MKRTKKMMLVTLMATTAVAMLLMSKAFAAPATTSCPNAQAAQKILTQMGTTLPTNMTVNQIMQQLLDRYGIKLPTSGSTTCPKVTVTTAPKATATPAPTATPKPTTAPTATPKPTATAQPTTPPVSGSMSADESKMINLVNQDRGKAGLKAYTFDSTLRAGALVHSKDMSANNYFSHTSPTQGDFTTRIRAAGVKYTSAGENIAMYGSVESAETAFLNSPGHRANIMNANFTRVGIGIVYNQSKGSYYITQWFAK